LLAKTHDTAYLLASGYVLIKSVLDGGLPSDITLTPKELANKSVFEAIKLLNKSHYGTLWMENEFALASNYAAYRSYDDAALEMKKKDEAHDKSNAYIKTVSTTVHAFLPKLTTKMWANKQAKEKQRKISAELKKFLKPLAI